MKRYFLLLLLCLGLYLPGLSTLPPLDRDESRFAQASKQMMESGDYIRIHFQDEIRAKKPAGVYWLQVASAKLTGVRDAIWPYRLPSLCGAIVAVLLTYALGSAVVGPAAAFSGAGLLASCLLLIGEADQAKTDAVQLACIVAAQGLLGRLYMRRGTDFGWGPAFGFWAAQGIGILVKGPVVPMVSALTVAALVATDRRVAWLKPLRPLPGLLLAAAIVGPWVWAISQATQGQFIGQAVKTDLLPKLLGAQESHGAPPGTYLGLMMATLWPASLAAFPALPFAWRYRKEPALRFLLAWLVPSWIMFELIPTKLPHYILPVYPALGLMAGLWLEDAAIRSWHKVFAILWGLLSTAIALALCLGIRRFDPAASIGAALPGLVLAGASWRLVWLFCRGRTEKIAGEVPALGVLASILLFFFVLPHLDNLWVGRMIARAVPAGAPLTVSGYGEPSVVFLHGTGTKLAGGADAAQFLIDHPDGWAAVESKELPAFTEKLPEAKRVANIDGFNYSHGKPARVTLFRLTETAP